MKVCIAGGGGGASNAANIIRSLDNQAHIDIFTNRDEIGNLPCEIPFVLNGMLPSWESSFAFRNKFYEERNIKVHLNTKVTEIVRQEKRLWPWASAPGCGPAARMCDTLMGCRTLARPVPGY